uniref:BZIP domain-containing protein n=1 Tax=Macrostomum lignano TaxID=282301 RepID=A0A1I8FDE1_9PLAT
PPLASTQALRRHPTMHTAAAVASAASVTSEAMPAASGSPLSSEQWPSSYQGNHSNSGSSSPASISLLHQQSRKRRRTGGRYRRQQLALPRTPLCCRRLPHDLALIGGLSSKSDRISDWLAANPLALRQQQAAYPSTIVGWSPSTSTNSMWNDQDTVALAFYQQPDSKDLMLGGGAAAGVSVLPKPLATMSSSSNGSQSPPQSTTSSSLWWQAGESELQINAELDQLFPLGELDQLGFDPDSFMGLLNEPAVDISGALGTDSEGQMMSAMLMPPKSEDGDQSEGFKTEECRLGCCSNKSTIRITKITRTTTTLRDMRSAMYRNKDPARLVAAGVKLTYNEVVTCSHQKFLALLQCYNRKQQAVLQEVRKRGKNRLAASKCRQKKSDRVGRLLKAEERRACANKYMQLYLTAFGRLRDAENRPLDPRVHRLQHGLDGSVILVARDAA